MITAAGATADRKGRLFSQNRSPVLSKINIPISSPSPDRSKEAAAARGESKRKAKVENKVKKQVKVKEIRTRILELELKAHMLLPIEKMQLFTIDFYQQEIKMAM